MKKHEFLMLVRIFCNEHKINNMNEYFYHLATNEHLGLFLQRYSEPEHLEDVLFIVDRPYLRRFGVLENERTDKE